MRRIKKYGVAIIGDENLIIGFRLAGVKKVYEIPKGSDERKLVRTVSYTHLTLPTTERV